MDGNLMKKKANKDIYYLPINIENILNMWKIIKRTCKNKKEVFKFSLNLSTNINYIYNSLNNKNYNHSKYRPFIIFEPKPRLVMSESVSDKIVNHFITNYYLIPYLEKTLIDSNVATRKNKGSRYAMELLKSYINKILINSKDAEIYCLKIDISKYFYTIDHEILMKKLERYIKDNDVLSIINNIINETNASYINELILKYNKIYNIDIPIYQENKGLSIGAMSSQFLAIFYLSDLDHFIKENLRCKYYIRYMDDFLILDTDIERLKNIFSYVREELAKLKLKVNPKSNLYKVSNGFTFLGYKYKICDNKLFASMNKKTFYRIKEKLNRLSRIDYVKYKKSLASYYGYFKNSYKIRKGNFRMKCLDVYNAYKRKYSDVIVLVKEGIFYKTFFNDAKLLWYLFDYKYIDDSVAFGNVPYDKVILRLNKLDIGYVIVDKEKELLLSFKDSSVYCSYLELAIKKFDKVKRKNDILEKVSSLIDSDDKVIYLLEDFIKNLNG